MKKMKHLIAVAILLPLLFAGCQKSDVFETDKSKPMNDGDFKNNIVYCGEPEMYNMAMYGGAFLGGTVKIGNDANDMLYITIEAAVPNTIIETRYWVGLINTNPLPGIVTPTGTIPLPVDGVAHFNLKPTAPWGDWTTYDPYVSGKEYMVNISQLPDCFQVVVQAKVLASDGTTQIIIWGTDKFKSNGYYIEYCKKVCEEPEVSCETAFALGENETCFLEINKTTGVPQPGPPSSNFNRWGWTHEIELTGEAASFDYELWAGAGQCDTDKGTLVGSVTVDWDGTTAVVTYSTDEGFTLESTHLYIGETYVPIAKNGKFTIAPGQYPYKTPTSSSDTEVVYEVDVDISENNIFYIIPHSVVCGEYDD